MGARNKARRAGAIGDRAVLPGFEYSAKLAFGGSALRSHPKRARPLSGKQALHLVLRSTKARGRFSFLLRAREIDRLIRRQATAFDVRVLELANAGNHFHIVAKFPSRKAYRGFVRTISGLIPRRVLGVEKGKPWGRQGESDSRGIDPAGTGSTSGGVFESRFPVLDKSTAPPGGGAKRARFWDARPFTRIVSEGRDYSNLKRYVQRNRPLLAALHRLSPKELLASADRLAAQGPLEPTGFS